MIKKNHRFCILLIIISFLLSSCKAEAAQPNFESLAQGNAFTAPTNDIALYILTDIQAANKIPDVFDSDTGSLITSAEYEHNYVVIVFYGPAGSDGYTLSVQDIQYSNNEVRVKINLEPPPPDRMTNDVITYPYHIILVPKTSNNSVDKAKWILLDEQNNPLGEGTVP
jgi:hypothetical protein